MQILSLLSALAEVEKEMADLYAWLAELIASLAASDAEHLRALEEFAQGRFADPGDP